MVNDWRTVPAIALFFTLALSTRASILHWHDNLTLWTYTVSTSPLKLRPVTNLAAQLILAGRIPEAQVMLDRARTLMARPGVPQWEHDEADFITYINSATVERIIKQNAPRTQSP